jgi:hypothetical protein
MGGQGLVVRTRLARSARSLFGLVLLGGLGFGVTLSCLAGARRTESAYERFVAASHPGDVEISFDAALPMRERAELARRVVALPQVATAGGLSFVFHTLPDGSLFQATTLVALDEVVGHEVNVPRLVEGRLPDPARADEVAVNEKARDQLGLGVGDTLDLVGVPADQQDSYFTGAPIEDGRPASFRVTGVIRGPEDLAPGNSPVVLMTPAYWDETVGDLGGFGPGIAVELRPGQQAAFESAVQEFLPESASREIDGDRVVTVTDATRIQAVALQVFAAVIAVTTLAFFGLAFVRQAALARGDLATLWAIGMTRRRRALVVAAPAALAGVGAIGIGVMVAVAASPLFPVGLAGRAEPDPGLTIDPLALLAGPVALLLATWALAAASGRLALRAPTARVRRPERALPVGLPVTVDVALRIVTNPGRGDRAIPIRSVIVTATIGVALVVGTLGFGRSLDRLRDEPLRYGWAFDVVTGTSDDGDTFDRTEAAIGAEPRVGDWTAVSAGRLLSGGTAIETLGVESVVGDARPVIIDGRFPGSRDEIALGRQTLADLDTSVGATIEVRREDGDITQALEVVGVTVLPGGTHDFPGGLGSGGVMTLDGLATLGDAPRNVYFLRAAEGTEPGDLQAALDEQGPGFYGPSPGDEIDNLKGAADTIPALVATLAVLALVALSHGFSVVVRRRRPELAILSALGLRPRQIRSLVAWQAGVIAATALTAGLALGLVVTKLSWGPVARNLGVADDIAVLPAVGVLALVGALVGLTMVIASFAAASAIRARPSRTLRAE